MAKLNLTLPYGEIIATGKQITFEAPCDSSDISSIVLEGTEYTLLDTNGNTMSDGYFKRGSLVSVVIHTDNRTAYVQSSSKTESPTVLVNTETIDTDGTIKASMTYEDIVQAIRDGKVVRASKEGIIYDLTGNAEHIDEVNRVEFRHIFMNDYPDEGKSIFTEYTLTIDLENKVTWAYKNFNVPSSISALTEDEEHRTVTDNEKKSWNNKLSSENVTQQSGSSEKLVMSQKAVTELVAALANGGSIPDNLFGSSVIFVQVAEDTQGTLHSSMSYTELAEYARNGYIVIATMGEFFTQYYYLHHIGSIEDESCLVFHKDATLTYGDINNTHVLSTAQIVFYSNNEIALNTHVVNLLDYHVFRVNKENGFVEESLFSVPEMIVYTSYDGMESYYHLEYSEVFWDDTTFSDCDRYSYVNWSRDGDYIIKKTIHLIGKDFNYSFEFSSIDTETIPIPKLTVEETVKGTKISVTSSDGHEEVLIPKELKYVGEFDPSYLLYEVNNLVRYNKAIYVACEYGNNGIPDAEGSTWKLLIPPYELTEEDKTEIVNKVLDSFTNVAEVGA